MIVFKAHGRCAHCTTDDKITTGSVGIRAKFETDSSWAAAPARVAVFRAGSAKVDVALLSDVCEVPPEVLANAGQTLVIGLYGTNGDGDIVIPTVYAEVDKVRRGAAPSGITPTPQTQSLVDQILEAAQAAQDAAEDAEAIAQSVRDDADSGVFASQAADIVLAVSDDEPTDEPLPKIWIDSDGTGVVRVPTMEDIGDLADLVTTAKDNLVAAINEAAQSGGGGGTSDYSALTNKPQINGTTLSGNKTAADLGLAPAGAYVKPSGGIPASDLASGVIPTVPVQSVNGKTGAVVLNASDVGAGTYSKPSGGIPKSDLASAVQTSLGKADTALQSYTETDPTVPSWAKASSKPSYTASEVGAIAAPASPTSGDVLTYDGSAWGASAPSHQIPSGGNAGECLAKKSSSDYDLKWRTINDWTPAGLMRTAGGTSAKVAEWSFWSATQYPAWLVVTVGNSNTYAGAITLKVNGSTAFPIYINGAASSATNYSLPAGSYFVYFDGSKFDFRTDGKLPGDIIGHADKDIQAPASPTTGDFLVWNGSAWAAMSLSTWQGGSF